MGGGLEALLGGGAGSGGPAPTGPPDALPAGAPDPNAGGGEGEVSDMLKEMLDIARGYIEQEQDEQNKLTMEQVTTLLQKVLAAEEKEMQDAMGGKLSPRLLSRAYAE